DPLTKYYWRVRALGMCGNSAWTGRWSFTTGACQTFMSTDVPVNIGPGVSTRFSELTLPEVGLITDINVVDLAGTHSWVSDIWIRLKSPKNTTIILFDEICGDNDDFNLNFNDQATTSTIDCPATLGNTYIPQEALSAFNGEEANGTWVL